MAGTIKGIIVEIGGDTSGLQKALKNVNSATSSLSKELRGVNSLLKLDPSNTELVAQKQTILAKNIQETSEKLELLKSTQKQAEEAMANGTEISEENYRNLRREIINTENKLKELQLEASDWTKVGRELEEFGNKVTDISSKIDNLGSTLTTTLTLPVLAIGTAAVTTGNSFEAQMSRVEAIAGATKDELEQLTNQAIDLGAETTFSASEVATGMENLASAGFTVQEIMDAMPGLLNLAASSGADLATSSEIAASAIRGFGLEASQSSHVADVFSEAAARTNAQTEDMGNAMKYIAPVANTMGLSIEEVAAAIGIMSDAGIKGEQAGTTLRGALTRLTKPTEKMETVMENLGISFYDSEGKMKSLTDITAMLEDATKDLTDEEEQYALTTLFGTESLSGMVALINRGSDELNDMTKSFEDCDGSAEDMADTMLDNTSGALESLSGSFESAGIAIQKALAPEIKELAKWIQDLVDDFNNLTEEEKLNIIKTAALVAAIGPAVKILSKLSGGVGTAIKGIGSLTQAIALTGKTTTQSFAQASTSTQKLAKAFTALTSPTGLLTVGITAAATATAYFATKQTEAEKEAQKLAEESNTLSENYNTYNNTINDTINSEVAQIDTVNRLKDELKTLVDENGKVTEGYQSRVSFILNELNTALGTEYELNGDVIESYQELQAEIDELIKKKRAEIILNGEEQKYSEAINEEKEAVEELSKIVSEMGMSYEDATKLVKDFETAQVKMFDGSADAITSMTEDEAVAINNYTTDQIKALKDLIYAYDSTGVRLQTSLDNQKQYQNDYALFVEGKYDEIGQTIVSSVQNYTDATLSELTTNIAEQKNNLDKYTEMYEQYGAGVALQMQQQAEKNIETIANELVERTQTVKTLGEEEVAAWKALADSSYSIYSSTLSKLSPEMQAKIEEATGVLMVEGPKIADKAGIVGEMIIENFDKNTEVKEEALAMLQSYYEGLTDEEKQQLLTETVGDLADDVAEEFENGDYETSGKNVLEGIYTGLSNNTLGKNLIDKAAGIAKNIANQFNIQWDEHSPSKLMKKKAEYFLQPISTVFSKQQNKLTSEAKKVAMGIVQGFDSAFSLKNNFKIPNMNAVNEELKQQTKMIYTTPTLNIYTQGEVNVRKIADEVNRIFGSKY